MMNKALAFANRYDRPWSGELLRKMPFRVRPFVARKYEAIYKKPHKKARYNANTFLRETVASMPEFSYSVASDDEALVKFAKTRAESFGRSARRMPLFKAYRLLSEAAEGFGIAPPVADPRRGLTVAGAVARLGDELWWRRAIRKAHARGVEHWARTIGMVHKSEGIYSSDESLYRRRSQKSRNRRMLEEVLAVNEEGQEYTLAELAELSVSNPVIRRGELMVRIAGFEKVAEELDHEGEFITLTCPSRMHAYKLIKTNSGYQKAVKNSRYDGTTPREAQQYLSKVWAQIRAKLDREGIKLYGFRVAEPNHDGCPHWHFLVFLSEEVRETVRNVFLKYGLKTDGTEPGADRHRVTFKAIDRSRGTAAGYIAKYIAKNIDGYSLDSDFFGGDPIEAAERVDAWASCWGIRQFQQLGGPSVTVWRELRRLDYHEENLLEQCREAADKGHWWAFVQHMGGPTVARDDQPIRPAYMQAIDTDMGEIPANRYGEESAPAIIGVSYKTELIQTRFHQWEVKPRERFGDLDCGVTVRRDSFGVPVARSEYVSEPKSEIATDIAFRWELILDDATASPWTCVNNCTDPAGPDHKEGVENGESERGNAVRARGSGGSRSPTGRIAGVNRYLS